MRNLQLHLPLEVSKHQNMILVVLFFFPHFANTDGFFFFWFVYLIRCFRVCKIYTYSPAVLLRSYLHRVPLPPSHVR